MILGIIEDSVGCTTRAETSRVLVDFVDAKGAPQVFAFGSPAFMEDAENWSSFYCKFVPPEEWQQEKGTKSTSLQVGRRKHSGPTPESSPRDGSPRGLFKRSSSSPRFPGLETTTSSFHQWEALLDKCTHLILFCTHEDSLWLEKELERRSLKCAVFIVCDQEEHELKSVE